jgi:hypothetical protein
VGRSTKLVGNPELAQPHEDGAIVVVTQVLTHATLGNIIFPRQQLWRLHSHLSMEAFRRLESLHQRVLELPVDQSNMRTVRDDALLEQIYGAGSEMTANAIRTVQHLAQEIEQWKGTNLSNRSVQDRIKEAARCLGLVEIYKISGYDGLTEIADIRDSIEHPKAHNVHQGDANRWDEVPLAWMLSDKSLIAYRRFVEWFEELVRQVEAVRDAAPVVNHELTVVRGIQSLNPTKKPPSKKKGER